MTTHSDSQGQREPPRGEAQPLDIPSEITFQYPKSRFCRVVHVDGAWGGVTAQGNVHMALYSEHRDPPDALTYRINPETGTLIDPPGPQGEHVREVEVQAVFSREIAVALIRWLSEKVEALDAIRARAARQSSDDE